MTVADKARDNAIHCEMVKYAYRQSKDGVVVSFVVHPNDVPPALSTSHIGARYMVVLVEVGDDEQPVSAEAAQPRQIGGVSTAGVPRNWRDMLPQQQAGIRCDEAAFVHFLREERPDDWHETQDTADCVRLICGVKSRAELGTNHAARVIWKQLDDQYIAWKALERA